MGRQAHQPARTPPDGGSNERPMPLWMVLAMPLTMGLSIPRMASSGGTRFDYEVGAGRFSVV